MFRTRTGDNEVSERFMMTPRAGERQCRGNRGITAVALISSSLVSRHNALHAAKPFLKNRCNSLVLVHCLTGNTSSEGMHTALCILAATLSVDTGVKTSCEVFKKHNSLTLEEALSDYVRASRPDLVLVSSSMSTLSASDLMGMRHAGQAAGLPVVLKKPFHQSLALRLVEEMAGAPALAPVLLVCSDPKSKLASPRPSMQAPALSSKTNSLNCLLDLQPTSRDVLDYLVNLLNPSTDKLFLSVSNAYERPGVLKLLARRMMAGFAVQASISQFRPVQLAHRDSSHTSLPSVVVEERIDLLAFQGPRAKEFSPSLVSLLTNTAPNTNVLIWPPPAETSLRPSTTGGLDTSFAASYSRPAYVPLTPTRRSGRSGRQPFSSDPGHQVAPDPDLVAIPHLRTISGETGTGYRPGFRAFM